MIDEESPSSRSGAVLPAADSTRRLKLLELALNGDSSGSVENAGGSAKQCSEAAGAAFFERYQVVGRIGGGGQGDVLHVVDLPYHREVALKRLSGRSLASPVAQSRFWAEIQIASQLSHPGLLPVFDVGLDPDGKPFYATVLLPGDTLSKLLVEARENETPPWKRPELIEIFITICEIMAYVHSRGVVHRDLTPNNILLGAFRELYVSDFGAAHVTGFPVNPSPAEPIKSQMKAVVTDRSVEASARPDSPYTTRNAGLPGVPVFVPPEILSGDLSRIGPATDIYAVGVMLYQLLTGRLPYADADGKTLADAELREWIQAHPPEPVRRLNRAAPRDLASICEKAMARDPAQRYASMKELAAELRAFVAIRPVGSDGLFARAYKWLLRHARSVLLTAVFLIILTLVGAAALDYKRRSDQATQLTELREADLARRNGKWLEHLDHLRAAERAGYNDRVHLALERIEAWTVLGRPALARAELDRIVGRPDLGRYRGLVLLEQGAFELFDRATARDGVQRVREALDAGLDPANAAFARGLLAESTPEAWGHFQRALELDPYHHGAHSQSMALEFLMGRHAQLDAHLATFKVLYPQDPSPLPLEAMRLALDGHLSEAEQRIAPLRGPADEKNWQYLAAGLRVAAQAPRFFDVETLLDESEPATPNVSKLVSDFAGFFLTPPANPGTDTNARPSIRFAQTPCVKEGLEEGIMALWNLMLPGISDSAAAIERLKQATRKHPEALLPLTAAMLLDAQRPADPKKLRGFLTNQVDLLESAVAMPSVIPRAPRLARFVAALDELALSRQLDPPSPQARQACVGNLRWFAREEESSAALCKACFNMAYELGELDLARQFLSKWETAAKRQTGAEPLVRYRIQLELASTAYGRALQFIDDLLTKDPQNPWARQKREEALRAMEKAWRPLLPR